MKSGVLYSTVVKIARGSVIRPIDMQVKAKVPAHALVISVGHKCFGTSLKGCF